jgi:hypothetical protein
VIRHAFAGRRIRSPQACSALDYAIREEHTTFNHPDGTCKADSLVRKRQSPARRDWPPTLPQVRGCDSTAHASVAVELGSRA